MPALPNDIALATREARIVRREDATIAARYPGARTQDGAPARGYFDSAADATTVLTARAALIGVERRRFAAVAMEVRIIDPATDAIPIVALTAPEQIASLNGIVARIEVDLDADATSYEIFG